MEKKEPYLNKGNIPNLYFKGRTIPEAWQKVTIGVWEKGIDLSTSFDNPGDPPSKDATVMVEVAEPLTEPRIHKNFPGGPEDLESYRLEIIYGIHDHWVNRGGEQWNYTYHERLRAYDVGDGNKIDQLENMMRIIEEKAKAGKDLTNRRFNVATWIPSVDPFIRDPPCLQRIHFRLVPDGAEGYKLNMNTDWRSRDLYKAWFMNVYGMTELQRLIALELTERCGIPIGVGRYCDKSDSLHHYGKYFHEAGGISEFIEVTKKRSLEDLTFTLEQLDLKGTRPIIAAKMDWEKRTGNKGVVDPNLSQKEISNFPYPAEWDE